MAEFSRVFLNEEPDILLWAFRRWREESGFVPAIADVWQLVRWRKIKLREAAREEQEREDRKLDEERRARGECIPYAEVMKMIRAAVEKNRFEPLSQDKKNELKRRCAEFESKRQPLPSSENAEKSHGPGETLTEGKS